MPERCVVYGCSNTVDTKNGIFLYQIPFWNDNSTVAAKRKKIWVNFIRRRRDKWMPTRSSAVCSKHFTEDCFEYGSSTVPRYKTPRLNRDDIGVSVFPSLDINQILGSPESERTKRIKRREVSCYVIHSALLVLFMHKTLNNLSYMRINLNIAYWPVPCNGLIRYFLAYKNVLNSTCIYKTITTFCRF
jgi:hypothetical protein